MGAIALLPVLQRSSPIIVRIVEPQRDPTGLAEVLVGSLGLTGAIVLAAVLLGIIMAAALFWVRSRSI